MTSPTTAARHERQPIPLPDGADNPSCPKCGGRMWDNRATKRNPKAPNFKCRNRVCDGVLWPGQRHVIAQAIQPENAAVREAETPTESRPVTSLRDKYVDLTDFVLRSVRPMYQEHGLACGEETLAAITATLFIGETRREGL